MDTLSLIQAAQGGCPDATDKLFKTIIHEHMQARIARRRGRNVLVDDHEIESEFLLGCWMALKKVKDIGNPLLYMLWKGDMAVAQLFRAKITKNVKALCSSCGAERPVKMKRGRSTCVVCGSEDVDTRMVEQPLPEGDVESDNYSAEAVWHVAVRDVRTQEIRSLLSGRVLQLFDIIVLEGIDRESSRNYLAEVAERWECSTANVSIVLRKLRCAVAAYLSSDA